MPDEPTGGTPGDASDVSDVSGISDVSPEQRRLAQEKKNERMVWYYLAYFLFGIHIVAFVMIYAVLHAK
ncbi:hypothetical protein AB5J56_19820 [Streptomyces sp. R21]|uniref:Uncharacterized protein n=1 Tax=Streptomyces sp. R21 TaxID=3238627 RepID=A0AB39P8M1_9ACTN